MDNQELESTVLAYVAVLHQIYTAENPKKFISQRDELGLQIENMLKTLRRSPNWWANVSQLPYMVVDMCIRSAKADFTLTQSTASAMFPVGDIISRVVSFTDLIQLAHKTSIEVARFRTKNGAEFKAKLQAQYLAMITVLYYG